MSSGPDGHALTIEDVAHVMRMRAVHVESDDAALVLGMTEDSEPIELTEAPHGIVEQHILVGFDALASHNLDAVYAGAKPDRLHDSRRAGLEPVRRDGVGHLILGHIADHLAAALVGPHGLQVVLLAVEHADAGRAVKLMTCEGIEIDVEVLDVDRKVHRALRAVGEHRNAALMRDLYRLFQRH